MKSFWPQFMRLKTEGTEGKVLNVKAKAMTVEKVVDKNEPTDHPGYKSADRVIGYHYEEYHSRKCKNKGGRRSLVSKEKRGVSKFS